MGYAEDLAGLQAAEDAMRLQTAKLASTGNRALHEAAFGKWLDDVNKKRADIRAQQAMEEKRNTAVTAAAATPASQIQYDAQGRMIGIGTNASNQERALFGMGQMDQQYQNYINQIMGESGQSPYLSRIQAQNQAMFAGMGLLGTSAATTGINQAMADYQLQERQQSLGMLGQALGQQAALRGNMFQGQVGIDQFLQSGSQFSQQLAQRQYESELSKFMNQQNQQNQWDMMQQQRRWQVEDQPGFFDFLGGVAGNVIGMGGGMALGGWLGGGGLGKAFSGGVSGQLGDVMSANRGTLW